jgi:hypothetical protein
MAQLAVRQLLYSSVMAVCIGGGSQCPEHIPVGFQDSDKMAKSDAPGARRSLGDLEGSESSWQPRVLKGDGYDGRVQLIWN